MAVHDGAGRQDIPNQETEDHKMDQYAEKVIRMDEKLDGLIRDVREMKDDVTKRVGVLEREKAGREDLLEFRNLLREATMRMASATELDVIKKELDNKVATSVCQLHIQEVSALKAEIEDLKTKREGDSEKIQSLTNFKWWLGGILTSLNVVISIIIKLWK